MQKAATATMEPVAIWWGFQAHTRERKKSAELKPIFAKFANAEGDQIRPAEKLRL
jgi:hypothetical protein